MLQGVSARAAGGTAATRSTARASPMPLPTCIPSAAYHSAASRGSPPTRKAGLCIDPSPASPTDTLIRLGVRTRPCFREPLSGRSRRAPATSSRSFCSHREHRNPHMARQKGEIPAVRRDHRRPVPACGERDQRIVLEVAPLLGVPALLIADPSDQAPGLPPVSCGRLPRDAGEAEERRDEPFSGSGSCTSSQLGEDDSRMTNDETSSDVVERLLEGAPLPVADVDVRIEDRPAHVTVP